MNISWQVIGDGLAGHYILEMRWKKIKMEKAEILAEQCKVRTVPTKALLLDRPNCALHP